MEKTELDREINEADFVKKRDLQIVEGELLEVSTGEEIEFSGEEKTVFSKRNEKKSVSQTAPNSNSKLNLLYIFLPFIFLTVALLGGMRLSAGANDFLFLKPALVCLIFAAILLVLFFRAGLIRLEEWFSEDFTTLKNVANASVLIALFAASTQVFNSLIPEQGLPFWVVAFCFFWTLWNNLFADFETKKLLKSLGAMFGLAFIVKYFILANLTAPANESWIKGLWENPAQEAFTWLLDLPKFSGGTGYIQFFTIAFYLIGLFLLPNSTKRIASEKGN
jgi:hypothetical protein